MSPSARAYLDHNATTPLHPAARAAMSAALDVNGNPSSIHAEGRAARALLDTSRRSVAALLGCDADDVVFTSGGTEALNTVLAPRIGADRQGCEYLLYGAGEHPAVVMGHRFDGRAEAVPLTPAGQLDLEALQRAIDRCAGKRILLALQAANNETGVIQPVREAASMVHGVGGLVVCDAVQAVGKIPCNFNSFVADVLAISAHKFGGPKGVGALCFGPSRTHLSDGIVRGGGQERGLRAGTENVVGISGLGAACDRVERDACSDAARHRAWRDEIEAAIQSIVPEALTFGHGVDRLPNTICFAAPGFDAQVLLMNLDLNGVAVSAGSACASGKVKPSSVLTAMNVAPELASSALRVSLGWTTTQRDIEAFVAAFASAVKTMRRRVAA